MNDVINWKRNVYQGIEAIEEFKSMEDRTAAIKELDLLLDKGKFPEMPTEKVA
jgi:hypothetical protein